MPTAIFGQYIVKPNDGIYVVADRTSGEIAKLKDGNPAVFVIAGDAFRWITGKLMEDK
jgi:hypothetical protein